MKRQSPSFQFYAGDYLADAKVQMMTNEEEGVYIRLLAYCWREGGIPADPEEASKLAKGASTTLVSKVLKMFTSHSSLVGMLTHQRLEDERRKQAEWREKSARGGRKSVKAKRLKKVRVVDACLPNGSNQNSTLHSSSSSSNTYSGNRDVLPLEGPNGEFKIEDVRGGFVKPTPAEVSEYAASIGFDLAGSVFCDHYAANGWKVGGKSAMKDWRAAVRTWKRRHEADPKPKNRAAVPGVDEIPLWQPLDGGFSVD